MHPIIEQHRDALIALCQRHHVKTLEVFGSAATGEFVPGESDVDLLVEFQSDAIGKQFSTYFAFKAELEALLDTEVDLVEPAGVRNEHYWRGINRSREPLYAAA